MSGNYLVSKLRATIMHQPKLAAAMPSILTKSPIKQCEISGGGRKSQKVTGSIRQAEYICVLTAWRLANLGKQPRALF